MNFLEKSSIKNELYRKSSTKNIQKIEKMHMPL